MKSKFDDATRERELCIRELSEPQDYRFDSRWPGASLVCCGLLVMRFRKKHKRFPNTADEFHRWLDALTRPKHRAYMSLFEILCGKYLSEDEEKELYETPPMTREQAIEFLDGAASNGIIWRMCCDSVEGEPDGIAVASGGR